MESPQARREGELLGFAVRVGVRSEQALELAQRAQPSLLP